MSIGEKGKIEKTADQVTKNYRQGLVLLAEDRGGRDAAARLQVAYNWRDRNSVNPNQASELEILQALARAWTQASDESFAKIFYGWMDKPANG